MTAAHIALLVIGLIAWGGLALCVAVAAGLTIRARDRQIPATPAEDLPVERLDVLL